MIKKDTVHHGRELRNLLGYKSKKDVMAMKRMEVVAEKNEHSGTAISSK